MVTIMENTKHLSLRIDGDMLKKFRHLCAYEGRSANGQLLVYIRDDIKRFEKDHGEIKPDDIES